MESGRIQRPEDAVTEALALWAQRERYRMEILAAVDWEDARRLADDMKLRGLAHLASENKLLR